MTRLSSRDVGRPIMAGPSASVIKKVATDSLPSYSQAILHFPNCVSLPPPYAVGTVGERSRMPGLGKPFGERLCGYI